MSSDGAGSLTGTERRWHRLVSCSRLWHHQSGRRDYRQLPAEGWNVELIRRCRLQPSSVRHVSNAMKRRRHVRRRRIVWRCLRDPMFSRFATTPACDRQTDERTDTQRQHMPRSIASRGKNALTKAEWFRRSLKVMKDGKIFLSAIHDIVSVVCSIVGLYEIDG